MCLHMYIYMDTGHFLKKSPYTVMVFKFIEFYFLLHSHYKLSSVLDLSISSIYSYKNDFSIFHNTLDIHRFKIFYKTDSVIISVICIVLLSLRETLLIAY